MKYYPTCSLCVHFDSNYSSCNHLEKETFPLNQELAQLCELKGIFLRDMNVMLDAYHYYRHDEKIPSTYRRNFSKLPKDKNGEPLFVMTKRGIERPIPAYMGIQMQSDQLLGVNKALTYQGQRELIYDLGVDMAAEVTRSKGVELIILPGEEYSTGIESEKDRHRAYFKRNKF